MSEPKIYDPAFTLPVEQLGAYADFVAIVRQLRRDCPWDREQTHASVKNLLVEEAYETVEAIDAEDWDALKKELGDLLLHVVFHSTIAAQQGHFTLQEVIEAETDKLVRRHPHVFGEAAVRDVGEVLANWEQIKLRDGEKQSALEGVPAAVPALLRAYRIQQKAAGVGFDFPAREGAWEKVEEEIREFKQLVEEGAPPEALEGELGDVLFALVNYARFAGVDPESALQRTNAKFIRRFQHVEARLKAQGRTLADADLAAMDALWDEAKAHEAAAAPSRPA